MIRSHTTNRVVSSMGLSHPGGRSGPAPFRADETMVRECMGCEVLGEGRGGWTEALACVAFTACLENSVWVNQRRGYAVAEACLAP